jgi:hypothetical protein
MLPSPRGPSKQYTNLVIWSRPRVNSLHCLCLNFHFLLPASSSFTSFLPASSFCIFGSSLPLEVSIRKLKLSSSIIAVFQDFSDFNCLLPTFKFNYSFTSGLLRLQLISTFFYFKFYGCSFSKFLFGYQHLIT